MNNVRNGSTGNGKRVWTAWLIMLCILAASAAGTALGEEDTIVPNKVTEALAAAREAAAPHEAALERFLNADDAAWEAAEARGAALQEALKAARDHVTYVLEGDTSLEAVDALNGSVSKVFTIDMNGYVLYAPVFATGNYALRNGTVADLMAENDEGTLKITVGRDACLLKDRNPAGMDLMNGGDLTLVNEGLICGFRRLLYQTARSNRIAIQNEGTIWSDSIAFSSRAFHQNSRATVTNNGTMVGLVRGLDFHGAGGSITVDGKGKILGAAGVDLEFPKVTVSCEIIADDLGLTEEEEEAIRNRLNPYGDKDAPTGIALDIQANQADYWITWKVTGTIYASQAILRAKFPKNDHMKGDFSPKIAPDSPSRTALLTAEMDGALNTLTGSDAQRHMEGLLKNFKLESFCADGGEIQANVLTRYAEADGKAHIRFSVGDSLWSRISGARAGKTWTWKEAENGTLDAQEPVQALNAYYQMKSAINVAGKNGAVLLDQDVELPEGDGPIALPQGIEIRGDSHQMTGTLSFTVNQNASFSNLEVTDTPLMLKSNIKQDTEVLLQGGHYGTLKLDNIILSSRGAVIDNLEMTMWGGRADYQVPVAHQLRLISTERISGAFRFLMDVAPDQPEDAAIDLTLMKGNQSKTFLFEGTTGAPAVTVLVLNDQESGKAFRPSGKSSPDQVYAVYLKVINVRGLKKTDGERPEVVFRDEDGNWMYTFAQNDDGKWTFVR